ncbi:DUF2795 domain-containing protein [Actinoplanes sp. NPDC048796]|uniref:DUF2795 domain-containing protein n=1 Tax=unclassified Actinoplanes TaxID=2626549 RepID=UPI0033C56B3E
MERGSSKHSPRVDDALERGERGQDRGRSEEWKMAEPSGEDQPATSPVDDENGLSRFGRYIGLSALPGDREALRRSAETLGAPDDVLADIDSLPDGETYDNVSQIWAALGRG